ncbi:hypothetical protein [Corallococcus sp. RDP092CA]|uniref:hypothetical protein n=1 Tax=Corallococcus sp. RDP092CA TaxID=3109369 RepID=UPI0035B09F23
MADETPPDDAVSNLLGDKEFRSAFGEDLEQTLDLETWRPGIDPKEIMLRYQREISTSVQREDRMRELIRKELLPQIAGRRNGPAEAGVFQTHPEELTTVHEGLLFPGNVIAVLGTAVSHESLPLSITQIGVAAVGYQGSAGTFSQRLFRKDLAAKDTNSLKEAVDYIANRHNPKTVSHREIFSRLAQRGIRTYAERAVLVDKATTEWRIGHGNPFAHELLTGSGHIGLLKASLTLLARLVREQQKFVFVSSAQMERGLMTLGLALDAGEYIVFENLDRPSRQLFQYWMKTDPRLPLVQKFVEIYCPNVLLGVFRVSSRTAPRLFYAHREHVHMAVRVAMADSIMRLEKSYPLLLDVAELACRSVFGEDGFEGLVQDAYAQAGAHLQYLLERESRR